jgi:hypothetical protein
MQIFINFDLFCAEKSKQSYYLQFIHISLLILMYLIYAIDLLARYLTF